MADIGFSYAIKLLSVRDYFTEELRKKIIKKIGSNELADETIYKLKEMGYLDDDKVAYNYTRYKLSSGYGPYYIANKLYELGCQKDISYIESVADAEGIDLESFIIKYSKKYKTKNSEDSFKNYVKCVNFLKNKGYPTDLIMNTLDEGDFE